MLKSEVIKRFLTAKTHNDLAALYHVGMECQVNVAQGDGERVSREYKGKPYQAWSNAEETWKSFRIPYNAHSTPDYTDHHLNWNFEKHVEAIGMTGWNWKTLTSEWVAYDFDSILTHSDALGLTNTELEEIKTAMQEVEWVSIRKSTSGTGLHLYVQLPSINTANHTEHAALARSILGQLTALTGLELQGKVDICGGNMWVWHRKMEGTDGLELLKQGDVHTDVSPNWRDHVVVVSRKRKQVEADTAEDLANQWAHSSMDEEHRKVITYLKDINAVWWWDQDHHMLVTHTFYLQEAHKNLNLRGFFETVATGKDKGADHNCFCFPLSGGSWAIRRYGKGVQEHESWNQDGQGWTYCIYNKEPDLRTAARSLGGIEDLHGGFCFTEAEVAIQAAAMLGVNMQVAPRLINRKTVLKTHKDGRLVAEVDRDPADPANEMQNWLAKGTKPWTQVFNVRVNSTQQVDYTDVDGIVRHLITSTRENYGWVIKAEGGWQDEPLAHLRVALTSSGMKGGDVSNTLGVNILKPWMVVNRPFEPEYPGNREWNRSAAQLRYEPAQKENLTYPTWLKVLTHCGRGLDDAIEQDSWCQSNGILTGCDYLKCWVASLFQHPTEPLPYLYLYGPEESGKSIFHEALQLLLTKGYVFANAALINNTGFNAELEGAIVCVTEEINLSKNQGALHRIKDWVTSRQVLVHRKCETPYLADNTTHWIQCSNHATHCPVLPGDTRIVSIYVPSLEQQIPKRKLIRDLQAEAPDFIAEMLRLEIPRSESRLNIPIVVSTDKLALQRMNATPLQMFIDECCDLVNGHWIKYSEFYAAFEIWADPQDTAEWTQRKVGRNLPSEVKKGRNPTDGSFHLGNIAWQKDAPHEVKSFKYVLGGPRSDQLKEKAI